MSNKKYYWLKLKEAYFDNPKIKMLRKIAGGDTFTIIYLKMQLLKFFVSYASSPIPQILLPQQQ